MANSARRVDFQNLVSLADDLLGVLKNKKDGDGLVQSLEGAILLQSSCQSDVDETGRVLEGQTFLHLFNPSCFLVLSDCEADGQDVAVPCTGTGSMF